MRGYPVWDFQSLKFLEQLAASGPINKHEASRRLTERFGREFRAENVRQMAKRHHVPLVSGIGQQSWNERTVLRLKELLARGCSPREIARILTAESGMTYNRNMVLGKVNRLGLSAPTKASLCRRARKQRREAARLAEQEREAAGGVTFLQLEVGMCRWMVGDPSERTSRFCGAKATHGPYCEKHALLVYQTDSTGKIKRPVVDPEAMRAKQRRQLQRQRLRAALT